RLIYERRDQKEWMFNPSVTDDGRYLVITVDVGDFGKNLLFYQDLQTKEPQTIELIQELKAAYVFLGNEGAVFYFQTTDHAPRGRIISVDVRRPARENWREIVPEQKEA